MEFAITEISSQSPTTPAIHPTIFFPKYIAFFNLPPLICRVERLVLLAHLVHGEVVVQPEGASALGALEVPKAQRVGGRVEALAVRQATHHHADDIL